MFQPSKKGKLKLRLVYCPPFAITILELYFGINVTDHFKNNLDTSVSSGLRQKDLYDLCQRNKEKFKISGDYSSYDQTIPSFIINYCFEFIKMFFKFSNSYEESLYYNMVRFVIAGKIYHPQVGVFSRKRGIASGSVFTNLIDSLCNIFIIHYLSGNGNFIPMIVGGDDNVLLTNTKVNNIEISAFATNLLGMKLIFDTDNMFDKGVSKMHFLGSVFDDDGPKRDILRMSLSSSYLKSKPLKFPSVNELLESRIYTIFGYDCRLKKF